MWTTIQTVKRCVTAAFSSDGALAAVTYSANTKPTLEKRKESRLKSPRLTSASSKVIEQTGSVPRGARGPRPFNKNYQAGPLCN